MKLRGFDEDDSVLYQTLATTLTNAGSIVGSLLAGPLLGIGRWKCLLLSELLVILGSGIMLIPDITPLLIGRTIFGLACGAFTVVGPKYINEVAPLEISGPAGMLTQLTVTFGILVPFMIGSAFPDTEDLDKDQLLINIVFLLPMILAVLHVLLMLCVFRFDTPLFLKKKG